MPNLHPTVDTGKRPSRGEDPWTDLFEHCRGEYRERSTKGTAEHRGNGKSRCRIHSCGALELSDGVWARELTDTCPSSSSGDGISTGSVNKDE